MPQSPYRAARSSVTSQPSSTVVVVPRPRRPGPAVAPQHLRHRGQHQQWSARRPSSPSPRTRRRLLAARVYVGTWRQRAPGVPRRSPGPRPPPGGSPGSPSARTELAREEKPPEARSTHSPSGSVSTGRQPGRASRSAASGVEPPVRRGPRRHRLARDDVGGRDLDQVAVLAAYDAPAVAPGLADAEHVGHRRTAARPGLAAQHPAYDDALPDHVRTEHVLCRIVGAAESARAGY